MWLPSQLHVAFAPDGLRFCVLDPVRRTVREQGVIPIDTTTVEANGAPWQAWLQTLAGWLEGRPQDKFDLHVVLFDGFVRYQLLPWRPGIVGAAEWQAYAGHRMRTVYGELSGGWHILVAPTPPGEAALVTAIDRGLPEALRKLSSRPPRLVSLQPRFVAGFNQWRHHFKRESCWFATIESGRVCLGHLQQGHWRTVRNESQEKLSSQRLAELLHRLELTLDEPAKSAAVYVSGHLGGISLPDELAGHAVHCLQIPERWSIWRRQLASTRGL